MSWQVYLAGEIHTSWRTQLIDKCEGHGLPISFYCPVIAQASSDLLSVFKSSPEKEMILFEQKSLRLSQARNRVLLERADIVVVKFDEQYRQWNAAFDAGLAVAQGKTLICLHSKELDNVLKEIDAAALVVAHEVDQVVKTLSYICVGKTKDCDFS